MTTSLSNCHPDLPSLNSPPEADLSNLQPTLCLASNQHPSPAALFNIITSYANEKLTADAKNNLDVVIDHHWIFLHSKCFKQANRLNSHRYNGKWKLDAETPEQLLYATQKLIPLVADNRLPVVKMTNVGNVLNGECQLVVYCFPKGAEPITVRRIVGEKFYWGSNRYTEPNQEG